MSAQIHLIKTPYYSPWLYHWRTKCGSNNVFVIGLAFAHPQLRCNFMFPLQFSTPTEKAMEVIDDIISNIQSPCQCSITTNHITDAVFQCFKQNAHQVTFCARVYPTPQAEAMNIINNITAWSTSGASVSVHGVLLSVDPHCTVEIASLSAPECGGEGGTASPTTMAGTLGGALLPKRRPRQLHRLETWYGCISVYTTHIPVYKSEYTSWIQRECTWHYW